MLDFNKMVSDAKTDEVEITFKKIDLSEAVIVAIAAPRTWAKARRRARQD